MNNLPELNFDAPTDNPESTQVSSAPTQDTTAQATPQALPTISDEIWNVASKVPEELSSKAHPSKWASLAAGADEGVAAINKVIVGAPLKLLKNIGIDAPYEWNKSHQEKLAAERKDALEANPKTALAGKLGLEFAATAPLTTLKGASLGMQAVPYLGKAVNAATAFFKQGAATGAVLADSDNVSDIAKSAATTGALSVGLGGALTGIGKGIKAGASKYLLVPNAAEIKASADAAGMPISVTDLMKPGVIKKGLENLLDNIPIIGLNGLRTAQVERYKPIVENVIRQVGKDSDGTLASVETAINNNATKMKGVATKLFNDVDKIDNGMGRISLGDVKNVAQSQIKSSELGLGVDAPLQSITEKLMRKGDKIDFAEARAIRSSLTSEIRKLDKGVATGTSNENTIRQLNIIKDSLDGAIDDFGMKGGDDLVHAYSKAKTAYKAYADVFKNNPEARRAMVDAATMETWIKRAATEKNTVKSAGFQAAIGQEGQAQNRAYVLSRAMDAATDKATNRFNPDVFINAIREPGKNVSTIYGDQIKAVEGLDKLLKYTNRAHQSKQNPATGAAILSAVGVAGAGGLAVDPKSTVMTGIPIATLSILMKRPQLFINAAKLSDKTDPSVWNYMTKALLKNATNMGIAKSANEFFGSDSN